jgi:uridine monophosphate synthetase
MLSASRAALLKALLAKNIIKTGDFVLKSGLRSSLYIDLRLLLDEPALIKLLAHEIYAEIKGALPTPAAEEAAGAPRVKLCGVPYGALPFSCCVSTEFEIPQVIVRKEAKTYGTKKLIEGVWAEGDELIIVEDIVTTGSSVVELIAKLETQKLKIREIVVVVDRTEDGMAKLAAMGYSVKALFGLADIAAVAK